MSKWWGGLTAVRFRKGVQGQGYVWGTQESETFGTVRGDVLFYKWNLLNGFKRISVRNTGTLDLQILMRLQLLDCIACSRSLASLESSSLQL